MYDLLNDKKSPEEKKQDVQRPTECPQYLIRLDEDYDKVSSFHESFVDTRCKLYTDPKGVQYCLYPIFKDDPEIGKKTEYVVITTEKGDETFLNWANVKPPHFVAFVTFIDKQMYLNKSDKLITLQKESPLTYMLLETDLATSENSDYMKQNRIYEIDFKNNDGVTEIVTAIAADIAKRETQNNAEQKKEDYLILFFAFIAFFVYLCKTYFYYSLLDSIKPDFSIWPQIGLYVSGLVIAVAEISLSFMIIEKAFKKCWTNYLILQRIVIILSTLVQLAYITTKAVLTYNEGSSSYFRTTMWHMGVYFVISLLVALIAYIAKRKSDEQDEIKARKKILNKRGRKNSNELEELLDI